MTEQLGRQSGSGIAGCVREPCHINRLAGQTGVCKTGKNALVASYSPHFGEEAPLVGQHGSGTIFFTSCNLLCNFCQNFEISHQDAGREVNAEQLAHMMLTLQQRGCHNINFVTSVSCDPTAPLGSGSRY